MKSLATAALAAMMLGTEVAAAADPVCGDVNMSSTITTTDALLVLKKSVDQPITLDCSAYEARFATCETDLAECSGDLMACLEGSGACPPGTTPFNGSCWLLGAFPRQDEVGSCDAACAAVGATCDTAALIAVGSGGTEEDCRSALDAASPPGAPHQVSAFSPAPVDGCGPELAGGCTLVEGFGPANDGSQRLLVAGEDTNCAADLRAECFSVAKRVCACVP